MEKSRQPRQPSGKITLNVTGMHCHSCELLIKDSLEELEGIKHAEASEKKGKVNVEYDANKVSIEKIKDAIRKEGYNTK